MEVIVPAAGLSTRFPGMKPKYLLRDEKGVMMIKKAISPYIGHNITVGILQQHVDEFNAERELFEEFDGDVEIVILPTVTKGPAATVYNILKESSIGKHNEFLIKDCDSFFNHEIVDGNYVCITEVAEHEVLISLAAKSFVITNEQGVIADIVEKKVVSDKFCVGGYKFESKSLFMEAFEKINSNVEEVFVSHVIQQCLLTGHLFFENKVSDYYDVGTANDWKIYNESLK